MTCKWKVFCKQGDTCVAHEGYDVWKCTAFKDKEEPLTNEEYIRSCSTKELAKLIYKIAVTDVLMDRFFTAEVVNAEIVDVDSGIKEAETWLKEKHEPLKNDEK